MSTCPLSDSELEDVGITRAECEKLNDVKQFREAAAAYQYGTMDRAVLIGHIKAAGVQHRPSLGVPMPQQQQHTVLTQPMTTFERATLGVEDNEHRLLRDATIQRHLALFRKGVFGVEQMRESVATARRLVGGC